MHLISVIMSVYKEPSEYIFKSISSILNQTYKNIELIVVLDAPDNYEAMRLLNQLKESDDRITVIKNEENIGLQMSLNKALLVCHGDYIARMDADDISEQIRLEEELKCLEENDLDIVGSLIHTMDEKGDLIPHGQSTYYSPEQIESRLMMSSCLPHPTWLARKRVYTALNGYRLIPRCEDYDFLLRAQKCGFRIGLCNQYLLKYRINTTGISQTGLLKQRLTGRYLVSNYGRLEDVTLNEIDAFVEANATEKECRQYTKADELFRNAKTIKKASPVKAGIMLIRSIAISKYYRQKILNMVKQKFLAS